MTEPTKIAVCNGTEIRVQIANGWAARLKVTAGALGIVDVYTPEGRWYARNAWSAFGSWGADFVPWDEWFLDLSTALAAVCHAYVSRRPYKAPRRRAP